MRLNGYGKRAWYECLCHISQTNAHADNRSLRILGTYIIVGLVSRNWYYAPVRRVKRRRCVIDDYYRRRAEGSRAFIPQTAIRDLIAALIVGVLRPWGRRCANRKLKAEIRLIAAGILTVKVRCR